MFDLINVGGASQTPLKLYNFSAVQDSSILSARQICIKRAFLKMFGTSGSPPRESPIRQNMLHFCDVVIFKAS